MASHRRSGKLTFLRANETGDSFGGPGDAIDVEVVGRLAGEPAHSFGLRLRDDDRLPANQAMFALLLEAFTNNREAIVEYDLEDRPSNGFLFRVELTK